MVNYKISDKMDKNKVVVKKFDQVLEISNDENVEKKEYVLIIGNKESLSVVEEISQKKLWKDSFKEYKDNNNLRSVVKVKLRVLKNNTWFVGEKKIADIQRDVFKGGTKPEKWEVGIDEDYHPYKIYKFGKEKYKVYSKLFLKKPENVSVGRQGGERRFYHALVKKAFDKMSKESPELIDKFYKEFPEMKEYEEKLEKTRQYKLRKKHALSTEDFNESELLSDDSCILDKIDKFGEFLSDFLKESGYKQKLEKNEINKVNAFNRYIQNFAEKLEKKGFEFKEEMLT
ncbi:MAG: hypothetical protein ACOCP8_07920 [archaeon]